MGGFEEADGGEACCVIAIAANQRVGTLAAVEQVIAAAAIQNIVQTVTGDGFRLIAGGDVFDAGQRVGFDGSADGTMAKE